MSAEAEREELDRRRRALPHFVTVGGKIEGRTLYQDIWITQPWPRGTDLSKVPWKKVRAVVDTGCTDSALRLDIVAELGLPVIDIVPVGTASSGSQPQDTQRVAAIVLIFESVAREAIEQTRLLAADMDDEMLLGMDLLAQGILIVDCVHGVWEWRLHAPGAHSPTPFLD